MLHEVYHHAFYAKKMPSAPKNALNHLDRPPYIYCCRAACSVPDHVTTSGSGAHADLLRLYRGGAQQHLPITQAERQSAYVTKTDCLNQRDGIYTVAAKQETRIFAFPKAPPTQQAQPRHTFNTLIARCQPLSC